jgi:hypothetical protein
MLVGTLSLYPFFFLTFTLHYISNAVTVEARALTPPTLLHPPRYP